MWHMGEVLTERIVLPSWSCCIELAWSAKSLEILLCCKRILPLLWYASLKLVLIKTWLLSAAEERLWHLLVCLELIWHLLLVCLKLVFHCFFFDLLFQYLL
jgi:hypothetical protein